MFRTSLVICLTFLCCSCTGPSIRYNPIRPSGVSLPPDANIDLFLPNANMARAYDVLGRLSIGDTGLSINCGWNEVIELAKQKAREAGAQAVLLTEVREPDSSSTCYRIKAELIKYKDISIAATAPRQPASGSQPSMPDSPSPPTRRWAVVVGIANYRDSSWAAIPFADDDASMFRQWLLEAGWSSSQIKCLTNAQATERNIKIALESWLTKAKREDLIVLYWAGHGFPDPEDPEKVYFACYDTDIRIPATGFRMDQVVRVLRERNVKNVILLADTCHAGKLITRGERGLSVVPIVKRMQEQNTVPKGWVFMVSADTDRKAVEHSSWRNGAFTHCLLQGLGGKADGFQSVGARDGTITLGELRAYLTTAMPDETQRVLGVAKHPVITTSTGDPSIWNLTLQAK